jgi:uncharacterized protein YheU (UPF0270 family)
MIICSRITRYLALVGVCVVFALWSDRAWAQDASCAGTSLNAVYSDFNGDCKADMLWRSTISGTAIIWLMNGAEITDEGSHSVPLDWRFETIKDFDGNGKADIMWRNTTNNTAIIWFMDGVNKTEAQAVGFVQHWWEAH